MHNNKQNISSQKIKKISILALKNAIRLHLDSILLYKNKSYPSALQLSILALEELAKARGWERYYWVSSTEGPLPPDEEEKYFKNYYSHLKKHKLFYHQEIHNISKEFDNQNLNKTKQNATYVGLFGNNSIKHPFNITDNEARVQISLINDILLEMCFMNIQQGEYFTIGDMDSCIDKSLCDKLLRIWKHKSKVKSRAWFESWQNNLSQKIKNEKK